MQDIKNDPAWKNGDYPTPPTEGLRGASDLLVIAGGAPLQLQKNYPTRAQVEAYVDKIIAADIAHTDANDFLYYVNASRNYNPAPKLSTITAPVLWINSADDHRPPELGIPGVSHADAHAKFILIPISARPAATAHHRCRRLSCTYRLPRLTDKNSRHQLQLQAG